MRGEMEGMKERESEEDNDASISELRVTLLGTHARARLGIGERAIWGFAYSFSHSSDLPPSPSMKVESQPMVVEE